MYLTLKKAVKSEIKRIEAAYMYFGAFPGLKFICDYAEKLRFAHDDNDHFNCHHCPLLKKYHVVCRSISEYKDVNNHFTINNKNAFIKILESL